MLLCSVSKKSLLTLLFLDAGYIIWGVARRVGTVERFRCRVSSFRYPSGWFPAWVSRIASLVPPSLAWSCPFPPLSQLICAPSPWPSSSILFPFASAHRWSFCSSLWFPPILQSSLPTLSLFLPPRFFPSTLLTIFPFIVKAPPLNYLPSGISPLVSHCPSGLSRTDFCTRCTVFCRFCPCLLLHSLLLLFITEPILKCHPSLCDRNGFLKEEKGAVRGFCFGGSLWI